MDRPRFTSIGRPVDPAWPTNRAILLLSVTVVIVVAAFRLLFGGLGFLPAAVAGLLAGGTVFFAWALAREVDPDHDLAAFAGALIALPAWELLGSPRFAAVVLLLLALRIVNRTVGPAARPLDSIAILLLAGWVAWSGDWVTTFAVFLAFVLDATLTPAHRSHLAGAGAALALTGLAATRSGFPPSISGASLGSLGALVLMLPFLPVMARSGTLRTLTDVDTRPLIGTRVRSAQALAILAVALAVFVDGTGGLAEISPLWSAIVGCGLYGLLPARGTPA
ncbi:MAG: hypothetical protein M8867_10285 [marine benthic group bacterium]|jgi:hypothetical protein|nr:hypothetical protein [Gemmatimonadota bacterium]